MNRPRSIAEMAEIQTIYLAYSGRELKGRERNRARVDAQLQREQMAKQRLALEPAGPRSDLYPTERLGGKEKHRKNNAAI